CQKYSTSPWTF
nr:immunoglobulin light chain junction region [Macaca mulatta]